MSGSILNLNYDTCLKYNNTIFFKLIVIGATLRFFLKLNGFIYQQIPFVLDISDIK